MRITDSQRRKVYSWETAYLPNPMDDKIFTDKLEIEQFVEQALRWFWHNPKPNSHNIPTVQIVKGTRKSASGGLWRIKLPDNNFGRSQITIIHEIAHVIEANLRLHQHIDDVGAHGAWFVAIEIELLKRFTKLPFRQIAKDAKSSKVKFIPRRQVKLLRKRIKDEGIHPNGKKKYGVKYR